jgi:hypothetical protein
METEAPIPSLKATPRSVELTFAFMFVDIVFSFPSNKILPISGKTHIQQITVSYHLSEKLYHVTPTLSTKNPPKASRAPLRNTPP